MKGKDLTFEEMCLGTLSALADIDGIEIKEWNCAYKTDEQEIETYLNKRFDNVPDCMNRKLYVGLINTDKIPKKINVRLAPYDFSVRFARSKETSPEGFLFVKYNSDGEITYDWESWISNRIQAKIDIKFKELGFKPGSPGNR